MPLATRPNFIYPRVQLFILPQQKSFWNTESPSSFFLLTLVWALYLEPKKRTVTPTLSAVENNVHPKFFLEHYCHGCATKLTPNKNACWCLMTVNVFETLSDDHDDSTWLKNFICIGQTGNIAQVYNFSYSLLRKSKRASPPWLQELTLKVQIPFCRIAMSDFLFWGADLNACDANGSTLLFTFFSTLLKTRGRAFAQMNDLQT